MDENSQNVVWINDSRTTLAYLNFKDSLSSLDNLLQGAYFFFSKKMLIILRKCRKHANFGVGSAVKMVGGEIEGKGKLGEDTFSVHPEVPISFSLAIGPDYSIL